MRTILSGILAIGLLAVLISIEPTAGKGNAADPPEQPWVNRGLGLGPDVMGQLTLTAAQVTQLDTIDNQYLADIKAPQDKLKTAFGQLAQLWVAAPPDKAAIAAKIAEIDTLQKQIRDQMVVQTYAVMNVLTDQQRARLQDLVANRPGFGVGLGFDLATGCNTGTGLTPVDLGAVPDVAAEGQSLFTLNCVVCHGANGEKIAGWKGKVKKMTHAQIEQVIHNGRAGMPAFGAKFTDPQIDAVATYSEQLAKQ